MASAPSAFEVSAPVPDLTPELFAEAATTLDEDQLEAVMSDAERLLVIAGAGSGKTRVFVHRIARLIAEGADPASILAVSYTGAAANEVRQRLEAMGVRGVQAMTLHAWCNREPMKRFSHLIGKEGFSIMDKEGSEEVLREDLRLGERAAQAAQTELTVTKSLVEELRPSQLVEEYDRILAQRGKLDFDDLQVGALRLLQEHPEVLLHYRRTIAHVLVDEYQDINPVQHEILRMLCVPPKRRRGGQSATARKVHAAPTPTLTLVGDPRQAIYAFRGSDDAFILGFAEEFADGEEVELRNNYRSTSGITTFADEIVAPERSHTNVMVPLRGEGPRPEVRSYRDEEAEAAAVARHAKRLIENGTPAEEIAVLYRYHRQAGPIAEALETKDVPYRVAKEEGPSAGFAGSVVLRTIHSSKGLEYSATILVGWADGAIPTYRVRDNPDLIHEERRLAYVAVTRAKDDCLITWPMQAVLPNGGTMPQSISRFAAF